MTADDSDTNSASDTAASAGGADNVADTNSADNYSVPATLVRNQTVLHPGRDELLGLAAELKADGYVQCVDLCAVDYLTQPQRQGLPAMVEPQRFEVVAVFISHADPPGRLRARVQIPADDPSLPSLCELYPGCENMEREIYDMFGIEFVGHPDLTRILMPDDWDGHPLRRDYSVGQVPVQFKDAPSR